jgi:hypothetical protein
MGSVVQNNIPVNEFGVAIGFHPAPSVEGLEQTVDLRQIVKRDSRKVMML